MIAFYTGHFVLPLPEGHSFPMAKYSRLREIVVSEGIVDAAHLRVPDAASREDLELERPVLAVTEAEGEPCVGVTLRLDVRDAPPVASDQDLRRWTAKPEHAAGARRPPSEGAEQRAGTGHGEHRPHDATVYSPP